MFKRTLMLGFVLLVTLAVSAPWANSEQDSAGVPAFHHGPPPAGTNLPPILGKEALAAEGYAQPLQSHAYELAAKIPGVIYQQPCYCYCDRSHGHKSLHSCFESTHGALCGTCMAEVFYSYRMSKQHKSAAEIRNGIIAGEWKQIDLESAATMN
jgi:hypothetical protein